MKKVIKILIGFVIVLLIALIAVGAVLFQFSSPERKAEKENFIIKLYTGEEELISELKDRGFIRNEWAFKYALKKKGGQKEIEPGAYLISKEMNVFELVNVLVSRPFQKWVVIPEGLRKEEVVEIVAKELKWQDDEKKDFLNNAKEGYLFPDTYLLNVDSTGKQVAERMMSTFDGKVGELFKKAEEKNICNDTLIILASLVQRETSDEEEMPEIAGVIWNRWLNDMRFEIDATVQYAIGEPGNWWKRVGIEDYRIDSPYNTYLHKGPPPAPICNPGLAAIEAVIFAKDSDYFYYLHDQKGQIHLARTYEEHLENIDSFIIFPAIETFVSDYFLAYKKTEGEDWQEIKSFLAQDQLEYLKKNPEAFGENFVFFDDFEILEVVREEESYIVKAEFYSDGKIFKNSTETSEIVEISVIEENGEFKTPNWFF